MLNVSVFTFNVFEENTYIITNEKDECWIVDPGMYAEDELQAMVTYISDKKLFPQAIINTHTHLDHIFGVQPLIDHYHIPFGVHELELPVLSMGKQSAEFYGFDMKTVPKPTYFISEQQPLKLGTDMIKVLFAPGHSSGSICFYYPQGNWVIGGDVLFNGSIGRTDLPGGNFDTLINSIHTQLFTLPGDTKVLPGHGPTTTIKHEQTHNPYFKKSPIS